MQKHKIKINAVEVRVQYSICGIGLKDRKPNSVARERRGMKDSEATRKERVMLRLFGHVKE